jgi:protein tyrosine/serine phosphatase
MNFVRKCMALFSGRILAAALVSAGLLHSAPSASHAQNAASISAAAMLPAPPIAEHISLSGVGNFGRVAGNLYRGAQPSAEGFAELKKLGVGIVVNFRDEQSEQTKEQRAAEALGMRYVGIGWNARNEPTDAQVAEFLHLVRANPQSKIFVHCHWGADRTGVMVATYRIAEERWTAEHAVAEMKAFHLHFWLPHLKHYVAEFPRRLDTSPELHPAVAP